MAAMARIEAWFHQEVVDRAPVRFSRHNAEYEDAPPLDPARWPNRKAQWYDAEFQLERFLGSIEGRRFHGETFPLFWPNLGPNVFAGCYGAPLHFSDVTSWAEPVLTTPDDPYAAPPPLDWASEYLAKLDELTALALEHAPGRFLVGYTDLHPGEEHHVARARQEEGRDRGHAVAERDEAEARIGPGRFLRSVDPGGRRQKDRDEHGADEEEPSEPAAERRGHQLDAGIGDLASAPLLEGRDRRLGFVDPAEGELRPGQLQPVVEVCGIEQPQRAQPLDRLLPAGGDGVSPRLDPQLALTRQRAGQS